MDPIDLSIVLPAYEEAENLDLLRLHEIAKQLTARYEILVIDTEQPRDATPEVCLKHGATYIPRQGGSLYGHAIRTGMARTMGAHVLFMDADGSHNPSFIPDVWKYRNDFDLVIASRYVPGGKTENSPILIWMSHVVNIAFRFTLGLNCFDVSNSFRLYKGDDLRRLTLECDHFDIVEEILVKLVFSRSGYRLKEVPITFEKRKAGKTKRQLLTFALGYIATLWRLLRLKQKARAGAGKSL